MEAFFRTANYPLVERSDMSAEVREEALDVCLLACEKHSADMEKCTQVRLHCCSATGAWLRMQQLWLGHRAYLMRRALCGSGRRSLERPRARLLNGR